MGVDVYSIANKLATDGVILEPCELRGLIIGNSYSCRMLLETMGIKVTDTLNFALSHFDMYNDEVLQHLV